MRTAAERLPESLRQRVDVLVSDVTTFAEPLMDATARTVARAQSPSEAFTALESLYGSLEGLRRLPDLPRANLVVSSLVLSELARYPSTYTAQLVKERFGTDLAEWPGYGALWRQLRSFASKDHADMLARLGMPGGVVYFADTVGRGPDLRRVGSEQRLEVMRAITRHFARIGLLQAVRAGPDLWRSFQAAVDTVDTGARQGDVSVGALQSLIAEIEAAGDSLPAGAGLVGEAATQLVCRDQLPVELEISALESILDAYRAVEPSVEEPLLEWEAFQAVLEGRGLVSAGTSRSWKWLEYACQIPRQPGGFWVRSTVLRQAVSE